VSWHHGVVISSQDTQRRELGDFLRRRRESLSPEQMGIPVYGRRRTPGLRRDEVAERAHMSVDYYERLEQGRGASPSSTMLAGLAQTLRLNGHEREHLYRLVGQAPPPPPGRPGYVDPSLLASLDAIVPGVPAAISDEFGTVLVENAIAATLLGSMAGQGLPTSNLSWRWFTQPEWRADTEPAEQHERTSQSYVADLRSALGRQPSNQQMQEFVEQLRAASPDFAELWAQHIVAPLHCSRKEIHDARVGRLDLDCTVMLSQESGQRLLLLRPADEVAAARLSRLAVMLSL
jgi:transcriptional regulator with XRE-family HTH domain